ncbi:MAG: M28 family peptidase [Deltaproteobacteria bacterium]|nr:M28 family peptidase [Deltaproteobacteria bacterium]
MNLFYRILLTAFTVCILNLNAQAATVHLTSAMQGNQNAIESENQIILTFGNDFIVIREDSAPILNGRVLASDIPLADLVVLRDRRPMDQRRGYRILYSRAGFRLALVTNPQELSNHPEIELFPITESRVILKTMAPQRVEPDPAVTALLAMLRTDTYTAYLTDLAPDTTTRYTCSPENQTARDKIRKHFTDLGLTPQFMDFKAFCGADCDRLPGYNVIGIKPGTTRPQEYVMIGAHYDSTSPVACSLAPGANDNGSGAAALMEIARVFSGVNTERSVAFVAFSGEEEGMLGSKHLAKVLKDMGVLEVIKGFVILDMISYYRNIYGIIAEGSDHTAEQAAVLDEMAQLCTTYTPLKMEITTSYGGSDHAPFLNYRLPGCLLIENEWADYPYYHTIYDLISYQDIAYSLDVVRLATAFMATQGGLLP